MIAIRSSIIASLAMALVLGGLQKSAVAEDDSVFEASGFVAADFRMFSKNAKQAGQKDQKLNSSIIIHPEFLYEWNGGDDRIEFTPYLRVDSYDDERTHGDIRELSYLHIGDDWDVTIGIDKLFWGVTESRHLVDIINQTDGVEDTDGEDKLGQPMINIGWQQDWGDLNAIILPYFRERTFVGKEGRLRGSLVVDTDQAVYESAAGKKHIDFALRYATVFGDWDVGVAQFRGTSRDPRFAIGSDASGDTVLVPYYDIIDRSSLDVQATIEEWLLKVEAIYENADNYDSFAAVSTGVEYTFYGSVGDAGDLGPIAEYHFDDRNSLAPKTLYDNDVFIGSRITLNDEDDTNFLAGILYDPDKKTKLVSMEVGTRLTDYWSFEVEARLYTDVASSEVIYGSRNDDHVQVRFTRYF